MRDDSSRINCPIVVSASVDVMQRMLTPRTETDVFGDAARRCARTTSALGIVWPF